MSEGKVSYWVVSHSPDLTETGSAQKLTYIRAEWTGHPMQEHTGLVLEDWCFGRFGSKVAYVQGVAPCPGWTLAESTEEAWREARGIRWGGYMNEATRISLRCGSKSSKGQGVTVLMEQKASERIPEGGYVMCPHCGKPVPTQDAEK